MKFTYTDSLRDYMQKKDKKNIIIEIAQSDGSDFEVTELHTHFVSDKQAELFISRQGFHPYETEMGRVLLPNYRLEYDDEIIFDIKKVLFLSLVKVRGVKL